VPLLPLQDRAGRGTIVAMRTVLAVAILFVVPLLQAQAQTAPGQGRRGAEPTMKSEMRAKLTNTQALLEAVVTRDFAAMDRLAGQLSRISEMEIASWQAQPAAPQYAQQAAEFLTAVQAIREAAQAKDIAPAGDAYARLTSSCITCHRYGRDAGRAPGA
jgi:cytochrome c556